MNRYKEALETMCRRCENHEMCMGTGCEPRNILADELGEKLKNFETMKGLLEEYNAAYIKFGFDDYTIIVADKETAEFIENALDEEE